jgi:hypothetical protein
MALTQQHFALTDAQLATINTYFADRARQIGAANDDNDMPTVSVTFSFVPVFGRSVDAHYDGEFQGLEVEAFI